MKRYTLVYVTFATLLLTGSALAYAGWCRPKPNRSRAPVFRTHQVVQASDMSGSWSADRWRTGQPSHWRACVLNH